ncbi:hypothetical protein [Clostridium gasigenes]|uniref:Uncharacterized protein n=1 Tax=Clostridium gasigenes TaxID=94869 RepID=A0A7X0VQS5_9CLOT|nr:hypothetical protein [Clostridium gasigenes]MBB6713895.1 hypothetical protein [Clostridium gasigenes]
MKEYLVCLVIVDFGFEYPSIEAQFLAGKKSLSLKFNTLISPKISF